MLPNENIITSNIRKKTEIQAIGIHDLIPRIEEVLTSLEEQSDLDDTTLFIYQLPTGGYTVEVVSISRVLEEVNGMIDDEYQTGKDEGLKEGYDDGYNAKSEEADEEAKRAYERGYDYGFEDGYNEAIEKLKERNMYED